MTADAAYRIAAVVVVSLLAAYDEKKGLQVGDLKPSRLVSYLILAGVALW